MNEIRISRDTLDFGHTSLRIAEINEIRVAVSRSEPAIGRFLLWMSLCSGFVHCLFGSLSFEQLNEKKFSVQFGAPLTFHTVVGLLSYFPFLYGIWERIRMNRYTLLVGVSTGMHEIVTSPDRAAVEKTARILARYMRDVHW